ncbi:MAG: hypothetical protein ABIJ92_02900 [Candidatus Aenigmatarchaeota archaeon]
MKRIIAVTILLLLIWPSYAASEDAIPYIEIVKPIDGTTVGDTTPLVVEAKGYELLNPKVIVSGEQLATSFPLDNCIYSSSDGNSMIGMYCSTDINLNGFEGEKVEIIVGVTEGESTLTDRVGLFVSGNCV